MMKTLTNRLRRFRSGETGSITTETVLMFPVLFVIVMSMFVFFDAFRNKSINVRATYTISDAISRETRTISNAFVINAWRMHRFLVDSPTLTKLRITAIRYDGSDDTYALVYSRAKGGIEQMNDDELAALVATNRIPLLSDGRVMFIVQTWVDYDPLFSVGLRPFSFENTVFTVPREITDQACYSEDGSATDRICAFGT